MRTRIRLSGAAAALLLIGANSPLSSQGRSQPAATVDQSPARTGSANWLADRRELAIGDVITIYVDEATLASARKSQSGRDNTGRDASVALAPPGDAASMRGSFATGQRASSEQNGDMVRNSALRTTVSVRIVSRTPDGAYQVKGTRDVNVDKNSQQITIEGILRAQDVTVNNEADGDRLANAKITVKQKGRLGKTRGGVFGRVIGLIWP